MQQIPLTTIREILQATVQDIPEHDLDEMAIPSYTHSNPLIRWLMWRRYRVIERMAELAPDENVLEFGCGIGLFLATLSGQGRTVSAIDLFPQFARTLAERMQLQVAFPATLDQVPDASLDLIVAADVLEHVDDLPGWVRRFGSKLKPGGRMLVSGPTENIAYRIGRFVAGFSGKGDYHHTDIDDIRRVFEENGLRAVRGVNLPFAVPPHLFRIFRFEAG
ncbi:MAG: class I SAM-dependent methyltransferase [Nitrospirota bacterium]|nr:class I SAM-dependent methyltransferase [Nitrospirota bacterium]